MFPFHTPLTSILTEPTQPSSNLESIPKQLSITERGLKSHGQRPIDAITEGLLTTSAGTGSAASNATQRPMSLQ